MFGITLNSIKTRVRLFFIINIGLVIFNYFYTAYYSGQSQENQRFVEISRENEKLLEKLEYLNKSIVNRGEVELKRVMLNEIKTYSTNLVALKEGGDASIGTELVRINAPEVGKRELRSLENSWIELRQNLQIINDKKIEIDSSVVFSSASAKEAKAEPNKTTTRPADTLRQARRAETKPNTDKPTTERKDSLRNLPTTPIAQSEVANQDTISYFELNPEVEKAYSLAQTYLDETLNKNRALSEIYKTNFRDSQNFLQSILFITFFLNLAVLIGGTFVIGTYLVNPLKNIAQTAKQVASGDVNTQVRYVRQDEIGEVAQSLNLIVDSFKEYTEFAENIGRSNFSAPFDAKSDKDTLGLALLAMRNNLKAIDDEDSKRNWSNEGFALFSELLRSTNQELDEFAYSIISNLVKYVGANQGGMYLLEGDAQAQYLENKAAFAYDKRKYDDKKIPLGQGLLGQSVLERDLIYLDEVPDDYIQISSGLGRAKPRCLLIAPLHLNEEVFGAIELASFDAFEQYQIDFIARVAENIASTIAAVRANENTKRLLDETRQYAEQMQAQEEEMRQNMEELATTQEEMQRNQFKLEEYKNNLEREVESRTSQLREKERELSRTLSRLQSIMNSTRAGIIALDNNYRVVAANNQSYEIIYQMRGQRFELGSYWFNTFVDESAKNEAKTWWDRAMAGEDFVIEERLLDKNAHTLWFEVAFSPIRNEAGEILGATSFIRDVSDSKLEQKRTELTAYILDNSANEVYVFDANTLQYTMVNERARRNLGYTMEELTEMGPYEIEPHYDRESFAQFIAPLRRGEVEFLVLQTTHFRKDGSSYEVELNMQYFRDENTPLFAAIAQDITERKRSENRLKEALERFDLAISATKEGLWEMDVMPNDPLNPDNHVWWSAKFRNLLGYEEGDDSFAPQLVSWTSRLHPDDRDRVVRAFYDHITDRSGNTPYALEYRLRHANGSFIWVSAIGTTLRDTDGTPRKVAGSIRDINRRKRAEADLEEKNAIVNGILNAAVNSIISLDTEGNILSINHATTKIFGYTDQELVGNSWQKLFAKTPPDFVQLLDKITEERGIRLNGEEFPLEVSLSESRFEERKIYVAILRDRSEA